MTKLFFIALYGTAATCLATLSLWLFNVAPWLGFVPALCVFVLVLWAWPKITEGDKFPLGGKNRQSRK